MQALNDFCMFGVMAASSLMAGILMNTTGWRLMNLLALAPLLILAVATAVLARRPISAPAAG